MEVTVALLGVTITYIVLLLLQWAFKRHRRHQLLKSYGIPGPKPDFFAGNMYHLKKESHPNEIIGSWIKKYGDVFGYYLGDVPFVVVKDLDILKQVLIKDFSHFTNRPETYINSGILPKSIVGVRDKRWKDIRNVMTPMFTSGKLKLQTDLVLKKVNLAVDIITKKAETGQMFDIYSMMQALTIDVIASSALAIKTNCQENEQDELLLAVREMIRLEHHQGVDIGLMFPFFFQIVEFILDYTPFGKSQSYVLDNMRNVIRQRTKNSELRSTDILQALLDLKEKPKSDKNAIELTEDDVLANAFIVFGAGFETTATSLGYTFYLLAKHPDIQQRLYEEIRKAGNADYATIQSQQYLDQVYSEALRLFPPVTGFTSRNCTQDHQVGPYTFPKGCELIAPVWNIHRDPDLWTEPLKFDPERFSPSNKDSIKNMSYLPFGAGPRNCVGARFAQLEAKTAIFQLLKKVKLVTCDKFEDCLSLECQTVITNPANGVWVRAELRNLNK